MVDADYMKVYVESLAREHAARGYGMPAQQGAVPPAPHGAGVPVPQQNNAMMATLLPMLVKDMPADHPLRALLPALTGGAAPGVPAQPETQRLLVEAVQRSVTDNAARAATALQESKRVAADIVDLKDMHARLLSAVDEHTRVLKGIRDELPMLVAHAVESYFDVKETAPPAAPNGHSANGSAE